MALSWKRKRIIINTEAVENLVDVDIASELFDLINIYDPDVLAVFSDNCHGGRWVKLANTSDIYELEEFDRDADEAPHSKVFHELAKKATHIIHIWGWCTDTYILKTSPIPDVPDTIVIKDDLTPLLQLTNVNAESLLSIIQKSCAESVEQKCTLVPEQCRVKKVVLTAYDKKYNLEC